MIASLVERRIAAAERQLGGRMDWARAIWAASPRLFLRMMGFLKLSAWRRDLPKAAFHAARRPHVALRRDACVRTSRRRPRRGVRQRVR